MNKQNVGIKQQIQRAETLPEIERLLTQGAGFTDASPQTRRMWVNAATRRRSELTTAVSA